MSDYNVNYTDIQTTPILMQEGTENNTTLDIAIFGNTFLEYGQELNENILHLLENFACPMNAGNLLGNATPDTTSMTGSYNSLLTHPTKGQIWYNSTLKKIYYWDGTAWRPIGTKNDVAANWGVIMDGQQLPKPVSATTGYVFPYSECIWSVSPANFSGTFDYMACSTDNVATVNMKYRTVGSTNLTSGVANYLIIGIRGNANHGIGIGMTPPVPSQTNTPTPTPSTTLSATPTQTPGTSPTQTPGTSVTPTPSSTTGSTPAATPTPTPTPSRTSPPPNPCSDAGGITGCADSGTLSFTGSNDTGAGAITFTGHISFAGFFQSFFTYNITASGIGVYNHAGASVGTITSITSISQAGATVTGTINQGTPADNNGHITISWSCTATENADHSVVCHSGAICNYTLPAWTNNLTLSSYSPNSLELDGSCGFAGSGHTCNAATGSATVNPVGGVPPYTYTWQYYAGSNSYSTVNPTSNSTSFNASGTTPVSGGGSCTGCTGSIATSNCPPTGSNITCSQVRCKITDSVGTTIYSPIFNLVFSFTNTA